MLRRNFIQSIPFLSAIWINKIESKDVVNACPIVKINEDIPLIKFDPKSTSRILNIDELYALGTAIDSCDLYIKSQYGILPWSEKIDLLAIYNEHKQFVSPSTRIVKCRTDKGFQNNFRIPEHFNCIFTGEVYLTIYVSNFGRRKTSEKEGILTPAGAYFEYQNAYCS